jgi:group I intron endonuclease
MGVIYKITNTVNGKVYVGQTCAPLERRWREHKGDARTRTTCRYLHAAMRKYGYENFTIEVVDRSDSRDELAEKEIAWIAKLDAMNPEKGYNCTSGGTACVHGPSSKARVKGRKWTEYAKAKRIATMRANGGWKHTPERAAAVGNRRRGVKASLESRDKMRESQRKLQKGKTAEEKAQASVKMHEGAARIRAANGGILPASSEAMKRIWKRRNEEGNPEFFRKRSEAQRAYWQQPEVRAREAAKWTDEMKDRNRRENARFRCSFRGVLSMVNRKRNWRQKNGIAAPPVRFLTTVTYG